jgi:hypothetical protein
MMYKIMKRRLIIGECKEYFDSVHEERNENMSEVFLYETLRFFSNGGLK